jgi:acyl-ACP thioesterase
MLEYLEIDTVSFKAVNTTIYVHCPFCLSHSLLTHVSQLSSQLTRYVPEVHSGGKMLIFCEIRKLISTNILHAMRSLKF